MSDAAYVQAFNAAEFPASNAAAREVLTRCGDGVMCVRFWGEITRDVRPAARQRLLTRTFHTKDLNLMLSDNSASMSINGAHND